MTGFKGYTGLLDIPKTLHDYENKITHALRSLWPLWLILLNSGSSRSKCVVDMFFDQIPNLNGIQPIRIFSG